MKKSKHWTEKKLNNKKSLYCVGKQEPQMDPTLASNFEDSFELAK